ncbi:MAG: extracellular solute-binding protein [Treponema sp.]|jgi:multiple sugar transport system substrate-binding protein|nr:extracellular solute-binding protein [Treponema sp.]
MEKIASFVRSHIDHVLLALGVPVLLFGLFSPGEKSAASAPPAPALVFTQWWQDELEEGALESLVSDFEEIHPEIKVELRRIPYEEARRRRLAPPEAGGQDLGDLAAMDPLWGAAPGGGGTLESPAAALSAPFQEIPVLTFFCPLFYNVKILRAAGFSRPPKTADEFLSYAEKAADPGAGVYGLVMALESGNYRGLYQDIYSWIWASGGRLIKDGKPAVTSREVTGAIAFLAALGRGNLLHPESFDFDEETKREAFIKGGSVFMIAPVQDAEILRRRMGEESFGFSSIPAPGSYSGKPVFGAFGWSLGISPRSGRKEEAGTFAAFLAERSSYLAEKLHAVPGNAGNPSPAAQNDPFYSKAWDLCISGDFIQDFAEIRESADLAAVFRGELPHLLLSPSPEAEAAGTAAAIQRQWEEILGKAE